MAAPQGNTNARRGFEGRHALELALDDHYEDEPKERIGRIRTLVNMWRPIIEKALVEGDLAAMKEINDRLDGRAAQSINIDANINVKRLDELTDEELTAIAAASSE